MAFGKSIKKLREEASISVDRLTAQIGVNSSRWRKWEEKDYDPKIEDQVIIERFFGMPIKEVVKLASIKKFLGIPNISEQLRTSEESIAQELLTQKAITKMLLEQVTKLTSTVYHRTLEDVAEELHQNTRIKEIDLRNKK